MLEILFRRVPSDRTLDLIFEMNRDIFENEFLIPKLNKIKEDTKYNKLNNNEESFRIFVENSGFNYSIITHHRTTASLPIYYKQGGLFDLVDRIYNKIYPKSNDIKKYYAYYKEKYRTSNLNYYKKYLKEREKKGIVLYNSNLIKKEQLLLGRDLKVINLEEYIIFTIKDLKKDIKLYYYCLACIDTDYSEYLYLMYLMEKITSAQSKKKNNFLDLLISKKKNKQ